MNNNLDQLWTILSIIFLAIGTIVFIKIYYNELPLPESSMSRKELACINAVIMLFCFQNFWNLFLSYYVFPHNTQASGLVSNIITIIRNIVLAIGIYHSAKKGVKDSKDI